MSRRLLASLRRDRRGTAAVELALLSPILILLFLGTVEVTQLVRVKTKLALAAQTIQDMAANSPSSAATSATLATAFSGGQLVMTPWSGSNLTAAIASVSFSATDTPSTVDWQVVENGATAMSVATACADAAALSLGSDSVIVVQATYSYTPVISYVLGRSYLLTQMVFGRPRNTSAISGPTSTSPTGSC